MTNTKKICIAVCFMLVLSIPLLFAQTGTRGRRAEVDRYSITVYANVEEATVYLDGVRVGQAPVQMEVTEGRHQLLVKAKGYRDWERDIFVNSDSSYRAALDSPSSYTLQIQANVSNADVYINGRRRGETPLNVSLSPGRYQVRLSKQGYSDYTTLVRLFSDKEIYGSLEARSAFLRIDIQENYLDPTIDLPRRLIRIYIDGDRKNTTDFVLEPGRHTVRMVSGAFSISTTIFLAAGGSYVLSPRLSLNLYEEF